MWISFSEYFQIIKSLFQPNEIHESVEQIGIDDLYKKGYRTVFLDVDNTILPYSERKISLQKLTWVNRLISSGFKVYLTSNNSSFRRINSVAKELELTGTYFSLKPFSFTFRELKQDKAINFKKSITIGDQLFTDVVCGNWLRMYSILVDPMDKKLSFIKTLQREIELFLVKRLS